MNKSFIDSKKAIGFLVSIVALVLVQIIGLPQEQVDKIVEAIKIIVGLYLGSQTAQDIVGVLKSPAEPKKEDPK